MGVGALQRTPAGFPGILAGLTAHLGLGLRPGKFGKGAGNTRSLNEVMGDVDEELEGEPEPIFDETRGDEDRLSGSEGRVAVTDRAIAELDGVAGCDKIFAGIGDGKGNEEVGAVAERGNEGRGHSADDAFKVSFRDAVLAPGRIVETVRGLEHGGLRGHFLRVPELNLYTTGHEFVF